MKDRSGLGSEDLPAAYGQQALDHALTVLDARIEDLAEKQRRLAFEARELTEARETVRRELLRLQGSVKETAETSVVPLVSSVRQSTTRTNPYWSSECWAETGPTAPQAVVEILRRSSGEAMSTAAIRRALLEAGWLPASRDVNALINATLARLDKTADCPVWRKHKGLYFYEEG